MSSELKDVPEVKAITDGCHQFSLDLFHALKAEHPKNVIYSPFSLSAVVAMAKLGARGDTAVEMTKGMRYPSENETLGRGYAKILASFQEKNANFTLATANRLFSMTGFGLKGEFTNAVKQHFLADVQQLDFSKSAESAAVINAWVEQTTQNKIKDLIPSDALTAMTRLVLVNGIYFKGFWQNKFDIAQTTKQPFNLTETDQIEVDMMYQEEKFPYATFDEMDAHAVSLPYKGDRLCMIIYVPNTIGGLGKIQDSLHAMAPEAVLGRMHAGNKVQVHLPRFKLESTLRLVPAMTKLGMKSMFSDSAADFSGIPQGSEQLFVSEIIQKAFIEVNEEGSEAAAATGMMMMMRCMPMVEEFRVDRPFHFQIVDRHTNFVLFSGNCHDPTKA